MRFLLDQNADRRFAPYLRNLGHDVTVIATDYAPGLSDAEIIAIGYREGRMVITNDTDFGELVVRHRLPHTGVILFRVRGADNGTKQARLDVVLQQHSTQLNQLIVVTLDSIRIRRTPSH